MYITVGDLEKVLFSLISLGVSEDNVLCFSSDGEHYVDAVTFTDSNGKYLGGVSRVEAKARFN